MEWKFLNFMKSILTFLSCRISVIFDVWAKSNIYLQFFSIIWESLSLSENFVFCLTSTTCSGCFVLKFAVKLVERSIRSNRPILFNESPCLTLSWRRPLSYRNQSIDLQSKSMDCFLYDRGLRHERVKRMYSL